MDSNTEPAKTVITGINFNTTNICLYCLHDTEGRIPCPNPNCRCKTPFNYENPKKYMQAGALKPGTILNKAASKILIGRCLGSGGFGITYLGLDALKKRIVVKEFMPRSVAGRASDALKITAHQGHDETYKYGLQKFVEEARMLAYGSFPEHPNIVTILTLFEENNTAYFTMVYRPGMTLEEYVKNTKGGVTQNELLNIMREVFNGLKAVHNEAIFHRDIKPSNIWIPNTDKHDTRAFLLDFGSARQAMSGYALSTISVFLTPGYAPKEQYKKKENQGAYTDIYACAATIYACMRGRFNRHGIIVPPPESMDICNGNAALESLEKVSKQPVSRDFSRAVHLGLQCEPHKRPQSVTEFEELLNIVPPPPSPSGNYELLGIAGEYEGVTLPLNDGPLILGRNPRECNLVISDRKLSRVSGVHCRVYTENENGIVYLQDVSRHGTTVNEHDIKHKIKELKPNDILNLQGEEVFQIIESKVVPENVHSQQSITTKDKAEPKPVDHQHPIDNNHSTHAGFLQRFTACLIDSMILIAGQFVILFLLVLVDILGGFIEKGSQLEEIIIQMSGFLISWIYYATMESSFKQATVGKMALGLIVTDMSGIRISFWRASGRFFGKILSSLILMIGFIMPLFTKKKQALHDMIAECLVVSK